MEQKDLSKKGEGDERKEGVGKKINQNEAYIKIPFGNLYLATQFNKSIKC